MEPLPITRVAHIRPTPPTDRWLVEGLWGWPAVGFIGGTPKSALCCARHKPNYAASAIMPRRQGQTRSPHLFARTDAA